jgi:hypothetical protein
LSVRQIETTATIAASPARVWAVLTDFSSYPEWNPFVIAATGRAEPGARLRATIQVPSRRPMNFRPTVRVAEPGRELRWLGHLLVPGVFDGEHYFKIESAGAGCRFVHGERFSGLLIGLMGAKFYDAVRQGFAAMNAALKARAEA